MTRLQSGRGLLLCKRTVHQGAFIVSWSRRVIWEGRTISFWYVYMLTLFNTKGIVKQDVFCEWRTDQAIQKSCVSNMSWKEIILFHSVQGKTFYSSIRLTFWRSKDKFYVTWFLTCMSLLSLFEWLSRFICLGIYVWIWENQAFTLIIFILITYTTMPKYHPRKFF